MDGAQIEGGKSYHETICSFHNQPMCPACTEGAWTLEPNDREITLAPGYTHIVKICHKTCKKLLDGKEPVIFVCLLCERWSTRKPSQIRCDCETPATHDNDDDNDHEINSGIVDDEEEMSGLLGDVGANDIPAIDHSSERAREREREMQVQDYFNDKDIWPDRSSKFFLREHKNKGDGKKGLIYNALIDSKVDTNFGTLTDEEVQYHFHVASMYHGMSVPKVHDVTAVSHHIVKQGVEEQKAELETLRNCMNESCKEIFGGMASTQGVAHMMDQLMEKMNVRVKEKVEAKKRAQLPTSLINHPVNYNSVRNKYMEGSDSILKNLPVPSVKDLDGFAHIPVEQIVDHMLALGLDLLSLREDSDWTNEKGEYGGNFLRNLHSKVKEGKKKKELPEDVVVLLCRIWSDGFEAFHIKPDNDHNSLQLFTITLVEAEGNTSNKSVFTMPFAVGFKKKDHSSIINQLLMEVKEMQNVKARYCGREQRMLPIVVHLQMVMNDYPEKCANTVTSQLGKYSHRWGFSCMFDQATTPSCAECEKRRFQKVLDKSCDDTGKSDGSVCESCLDWWSLIPVSDEQREYPADPSEALPYPPPLVKLNFKVLMDACESVEHYYRATHKPTKGQAEEYLKLCCVSAKFATFLINMIWEGVEVKTLIPKIWKMHVEYGIDLDDFANLPMHMMSLGVEKTLIAQTSTVFYRRRDPQNDAWKDYVNTSRAHQKELNRVHIGWCMAMPFSAKEQEKLGTANWQSEHYLAFTRLSLVHLCPLEVISESLREEEPKMDPLFKALKAMRVLWFCLMSHMFADEKVPSKHVDNYVKLFLSSCNRLHVLVAQAPVLRAKLAAEKEAEKKRKQAEREAEKKRKQAEKKRKQAEKKRKHGSGKSKKRKLGAGDESIEGDDAAECLSADAAECLPAEDNIGQTNGAATDGVDVCLPAEDNMGATDDNAAKESEQKKGIDGFFNTGCNFLSLLNAAKSIDDYENIRSMWEGPCEGYIQILKRELTTMRHTDQFMQTILMKLLKTCFLELLNDGNPFGQRKQYARALNVKVYPFTSSLGAILDRGDILSGIILDDKMFLCFNSKVRANSEITLRQITFDDLSGTWRYNLWYAPAIKCDEVCICPSRAEISTLASDYFVMLPIVNLTSSGETDDSEPLLRTVLCRSWRIRNSEGELALPTPHENLLEM